MMKLYTTLVNGVKIIEYEECYAASLADMWNRSRDSWGVNTGTVLLFIPK